MPFAGANLFVDMNPVSKHRGVIVPIVTPVTPAGDLDEKAHDKLIDFMLAGGVEGVFVFGTTGEGASVPRGWRIGLVERAVARVRGRSLVYAGVGDNCLADSVAAANQYLRAGADAVVAHPPVYFPLQARELLVYFRSLLDRVQGPVILYNIPATTHVSIPLDVVAQLHGHSNFAGIKDSENDTKRLEELLARFGAAPDFSILVGVGALMAKGLRLGAEGIVPSVGNLIPAVCAALCASAARGDWTDAEHQAERMMAVTGLYAQNRTLTQSLPVLKAALSSRGLCGPDVLPPLLPLAGPELEAVRSEMARLQLLD
jgi:dihydrodipicolinate synthase/N-acetylneuraminate lyase